MHPRQIRMLLPRAFQNKLAAPRQNLRHGWRQEPIERPIGLKRNSITSLTRNHLQIGFRHDLAIDRACRIQPPVCQRTLRGGRQAYRRSASAVDIDAST